MAKNCYLRPEKHKTCRGDLQTVMYINEKISGKDFVLVGAGYYCKKCDVYTFQEKDYKTIEKLDEYLKSEGLERTVISKKRKILVL